MKAFIVFRTHFSFFGTVRDDVNTEVSSRIQNCRNVHTVRTKHDALFPFNLFQWLTSTCFEQAYCSSSGGTTLYIQQMVHDMLLCWLTVGRIGVELNKFAEKWYSIAPIVISFETSGNTNPASHPQKKLMPRPQ